MLRYELLVLEFLGRTLHADHPIAGGKAHILTEANRAAMDRIVFRGNIEPLLGEEPSGEKPAVGQVSRGPIGKSGFVGAHGRKYAKGVNRLKSALRRPGG